MNSEVANENLTQAGAFSTSRLNPFPVELSRQQLRDESRS